MKQTLIFTLLALAALANPAWYNKLSAKPYEKIGYGASTSEREARQDAIKDIGDQIAVVEISEVKFKGAVMKNAERVLSREARAELKGAEIIRLERQGAGYFAAAKLDRRPIEVRLSERMKTPKRLANNDSFLFRSPFAKALNKAVGYAVDFRIVKEGDLYKIGDEKASIVWNEPDLTKLIDISQNEALKLSQTAEGKAALDANQSGYIAAFYLDALSGYSIGLTAPIEANQTLFFTGKTGGFDLSKDWRVFLIAVISDKPFDTNGTGAAGAIKLFDANSSAADLAKIPFDDLARFLDRRAYSAVELTRDRGD
ncbi:MAG: LPP20 family lipoprotein [Helicobacteraceae bacterium]|jgi:hypothetical protein|nr:LPP20 family lipoprotein [Helicobacteraceae bacterium]